MRVLTLLLALHFPLAAFSQVERLELASDDWPPFTAAESGRRFAIDLVEEALSRASVTAEQHLAEFSEVLEGLRIGAYDGSAALWKSPEREAFLLFSEPYLQNRLVLVGRAGSDVGAASFDELAGKKVAVVASYAYGEEIERAEGVEFVEGASDQQNLERLVEGEVDYLLADALLVHYLMTYQRAEATRYLAVGETPLVTRSLHFAVRRDIPGAAALIADFNRRIEKMVVDGTYNRILRINLIRSDVDGDGTPEVIFSSETGGGADLSESYGVWVDPGEVAAAPPPEGAYVDGTYYSSLSEVPDRYRETPQFDDDTRGGVRLLNFEF